MFEQFVFIVPQELVFGRFLRLDNVLVYVLPFMLLSLNIFGHTFIYICLVSMFAFVYSRTIYSDYSVCVQCRSILNVNMNTIRHLLYNQ